MKTYATAKKSILLLVILIISVIWLLPIFFLTLVSFKTPLDYSTSSLWAIPKSFSLFENIKYVYTKAHLGRPYINSIIYALTGSIATIIVSSLAAYSITRLKIRGSFIFFIVLWSGMIFPVQIYLMPLFRAYARLGLYDTRLGMFLIYTALSTPFCVFVFRNHFLSLPVDMQEAAKIEGCSDFQIYLKIIMPNSMAPIAVLALFQSSWIWNDLILGMVLSGSWKVRPVMNALALLQGIYSGTNVPAVMTGTLVASIPTVALFLLLQKYFIQGLTIQVAGE